MLLIWFTGMRKVLICLEDWIFVTLCLNIPLFLGFMQIQNGAAFGSVDKISNQRDGSPTLLVHDDGGSMDS
ncbi:protein MICRORCHIDIA [Trifolium repens]|nr:protein MICRORCHIDIA [Trifolium repens]